MKYRLTRIGITIAFVVGTMFAGTSAVSAEPLCPAPAPQNDHLIVLREYHDGLGGDVRFDRAESSIKNVRDLDNCTSTSTHGTYILGANIQQFVTGGEIYQLGYSESDIDNRQFVYAFESVNSIVNPNGWVPVLGRGYNFRISIQDLPNGGQNVNYRIADDIGNSTTWSRFDPGAWKGELVWWGAERGEAASSLGNCHNCADIDMWQMKYSRDGDGGALYTRDGISTVTTCNTASCLSSYDIYRSPNLPSAQHHHMSTTSTTNDTINFDNTQGD